MPNPVVHFEIAGSDGKKLQDFYSGVFGWAINSENPMNYGMVEAQGSGIAGGITGDEGGSGVRVYIEVDDTDAYLKKVESAGGKIVMPTTDIGMVVMAQFTDPSGNLVGIIKAGSM